MKTIDDAMELRRRIFGAFEMAESSVDEESRYWLTVVVVGGGPTGVEMAGQVRELAVRSLRRDFRTIDPASVRVILSTAARSRWPPSGTGCRRGQPHPWTRSASSCG